jgi:hypothetical protein
MKKGQLPPIGSEWYEDDPRIYPTKITVVAHLNEEKVVIARGSPPSEKYRTRASAKRFYRKGGYKPWDVRAQHPKATA